MKITFKDNTNFSSESGHFIFYADIEDKTIPCKISIEALEDIDPTLKDKSPKDQFEANRSFFEKIASQKISEGDVNPFISTVDLL